MFDKIPRPLLVFGVLAIGVALFFVIQEPHSVCQSQLQVFQEAEAGILYPRQGKATRQPAQFPRQIEACKMGNSPGACYDLFNSLRKIVRDLNGSPQECLVPFGEIDQVKGSLYQGTRLMIQLAWGEKPPERGLSRFGWFETPDLALYCQLKSTFLKLYGDEVWEQFRQSAQQTLPGEAQVIEKGVCLNCSSIKKASETLSAEDIWARSLFSLRCDQYL